MPQSGKMIIEVSKRKLTLHLLLVLSLAAMGAWFLTLDVAEIESSRRHNSAFLIYGIGIILVIAMGLFSIFFAVKLFSRSPGIVLTKDGIIDNSSVGSVGLIPWSDVDGIDRYQVQNQWFMSIYVNDPKKYLETGNFFVKLVKKSCMKSYGTPIGIPTAALKMKPQELFDTLQEWYRVNRIQTHLPA